MYSDLRQTGLSPEREYAALKQIARSSLMLLFLLNVFSHLPLRHKTTHAWSTGSCLQSSFHLMQPHLTAIRIYLFKVESHQGVLFSRRHNQVKQLSWLIDC